MKKLFVLSILALFTLTVIGVEEASAKRFGMGSSFGKQRSFKQPTQQRSATPQKATPGNTQKGSARTGMMGMLGGLALGGLLGAMFFGGAFEGLNFFDILIFGAIAFAAIWFLRHKTQQAQPMAYAGSSQQPQQTFGGFGNSKQDISTQGHAITPDIDAKFFLDAAKGIFVRMQAAWDKKEMDEVRGFCTPEIAKRIELEMNELGEKTTQTEVVTLNADMTDSWVESNLEWVAVHFTAMIQEQESGEEIIAHEVQEHWIFQHDPNSKDPTWYLAGIQQS